jgi:2OG-Fe(II) oxygenase superfamily
MMRLTRRGAVCEPPAVAEAARARFDREHVLHLPGLLDPELRCIFIPEIEQAEFSPRRYGVGRELYMTPNPICDVFHFLLNRRDVFSWVRFLVGCPAIGCFVGRGYRMLPGEHSFAWHDDLADDEGREDGRMATLSINLSERTFRGGQLQMRDSKSKEIIFRAPSLEWGDGLLFRVAESVEHCVTPVEGIIPKTAFVGWFQERPQFFTQLHRQARDTSEGGM